MQNSTKTDWESLNRKKDKEIEYSEFEKFRDVFSSNEKLQNYPDYLHIKEIKKKNEKLYSFEEAKKELQI